MLPVTRHKYIDLQVFHKVVPQQQTNMSHAILNTQIKYFGKFASSITTSI